jgi:MFS family permease
VWSDARRKRGSRRIEFYVAGTAGGAAAIAAFYGAPTFAILTVAYVALQATLNLAIGPYQAILPDFVEPRRLGAASSWLAALQSVGNAIGAICASLIADARMLAGTIDALLIATCAATVAHVRGLPVREVPEHAPFRLTMPFADLFVSRALVYVGFFTLVGYLFFYVQAALGVDALAQAKQQTGLLILVFTIVGAAGAALAAKPSDRFDQRFVAMAGGGVMVLALALFIAAHALVWAAVATCAAGIGWGIFLVADWALACRIMPAGSAASTMGAWNLALVLPQIAAPAFTTWFLGRFQPSAAAAPREAFGLAICEILLGIGWLLRLPASRNGE